MIQVKFPSCMFGSRCRRLLRQCDSWRPLKRCFHFWVSVDILMGIVYFSPAISLKRMALKSRKRKNRYGRNFLEFCHFFCNSELHGLWLFGSRYWRILSTCGETSNNLKSLRTFSHASNRTQTICIGETQKAIIVNCVRLIGPGGSSLYRWQLEQDDIMTKSSVMCKFNLECGY